MKLDRVKGNMKFVTNNTFELFARRRIENGAVQKSAPSSFF